MGEFGVVFGGLCRLSVVYFPGWL